MSGGLPVPLDSAPRRALLELVKRGGAVTLDQAVEALELSKTAVRGHLLRLEELGLIERIAVSADGPGRPPLAYRISDQGQSLFPTSDSAVLTALLGFLVESGAEALLETFFAGLWAVRREEYELELARGDGEALPDRLRALNAVLERSHFMPHISVGSGHGVTVRECHCPFPAAVRATRLPCRMEARFLADVVGAEAQSVRYAAPGEPTCVYQFGEPPAE